MKICGLHHVSLKCSEKEFSKVVDFYTTILGLKKYKEWPTGCLLDTGNGLLEIFNNGEVKPKGVITHIALQTPNVEECAKELSNNGYTVFIEPKDINLDGLLARICFCYGPLGEEIEFFQIKE